MMEPLKVIDLFAGIAGFSLGLHRAGGFQTVRFCEIDPFCQRVLAKHWPDIPCHDDITTMEFKEGEADVITAGFPCQDVSYAGAGAGLAGERSGLFREVVRAIRMVRPLHAILENVAALLGRGMGTVLGDLAEIGYDAEWHCIPASAVGAPHRRDRVWIIANPGGEQHEGCRPPISGPLAAELSKAAAHAEGGGQETPRYVEGEIGEAGQSVCYGAWSVEPGICRVAYGIPNGPDRIEALGNSVVPQVVEVIGRSILQEAK